MMGPILDTPTTGILRNPGKLAGGALLAASGPFSHQPAGARAAATHDKNTRAPIADEMPTFHCPLWPGCDCPGGTMRPECPGLKACKASQAEVDYLKNLRSPS